MGKPNPEKILQTGLAFWASKTLLSAVEMGLFTELSRGPESLASISERLGLHPRSARDFLDALVALGFLQRTGDRYANTPETDLFLDRKKPSYVGGILEMASSRLYGFWGNLTEALRTGEPQNEVKGGGPGMFDDALRRSSAPEGLPRRHDRHQPWRQHDHRAGVPVGELPHVRRRGHGTRAISRRRSRSPIHTSGASDSISRRLRRFSRSTSRLLVSVIGSRSWLATSSSRTSRKPTWC